MVRASILADNVRIASIDLGTNTALLLIADVDRHGTMHTVLDQQKIIRLGKGVDHDKVISRDAFERCAEALHSYKEIIAVHKVDDIVLTGTSAVRDAANRDELSAFILERTGLHLEPLTGDDEARWTYTGAISGLHVNDVPFAVVDIGGGSTEVSYGRGFDVVAHRSEDIGAVRLTEKYLHHSPPLDQEVGNLLEALRQSVCQYPDIPCTDVVPVAVAGTVTTLAALELGLDRYERYAVAGYRMSFTTIRDRFEEFRLLSKAQLEAELFVDPGRADIIFAGVAILKSIMERYGWDALTVSERGLRYGIALRQHLQRGSRFRMR